MDFADDWVFGPMNLIDRLQGVVMGLVHRDMGHKFSVRYHDRGGNHTRAEVEALLRKYHIAVYGRTHDSQNMHFLVKKRQAGWAEYIMQQAGVALVGGATGRNKTSKKPGKLPLAWGDRPKTGRRYGRKRRSK